MSLTIKGAVRRRSRTRRVAGDRIRGAVRGVLLELSPAGEPAVDYCGNPFGRPLDAVSTVPLHPNDQGREVILLFEDGDPVCPLLVGLVQRATAPDAGDPKSLDVSVDGRTIKLRADQEVSLQCGEASITLTRAGKVIIKGS